MKPHAPSRAASSTVLITIVIYSGLLIAGMFEGVRSVLLPVIQADLGISHSVLGLLIFASFIGFIIAASVSGFASDLLTDKPILTIGFLIFGCAVMLFPLVRSFPFLVAAYFMARFGMGSIDITASSQGTRLFQKNAAIKINLLHLLFAVGATIAPIIGSRFLEAGGEWRWLLFLFVIPCGLFFVLSHFSTFAVQSPRPFKELAREWRSVVSSRNLWVLGALLAVAIIAEGNLVDWIKNYSIEIGEVDNIRSGNIVSLFYLFLVCSRLAGGFLAQRVGMLRFFLLYVFGALILFSCAIILPFNGLLFASVGWFVGPLFPIVTLMVAHVFPEQKGSAMGLVFAIGGLIGTFNSFLLGVMHDLLGTQIGFSLIVVGIALGIPVTLYARARFGHLIV